MKAKTTRRALLMSALSLLLCVSMLVGTTFAWFTDSVTSAGNKIQAGTLKIDLLLKEGNDWVSIKENPQPIFDYKLWEPGYMAVEYLKVANKGNLALKWMAKLVAEKELSILADVIDVYVTTSETEIATDRVDVETWTKVGTVRDFVNTIEETTKGTLLAEKDAFLGIALKMQETAGNEYQGLDLGGAFDIQILATQYTYEKDSFDDQYDKDAKYGIPEEEGYEVVYIYSLDDFAAFGKAVNNNTTYRGVQVANNSKVWVEVMADIDMTDAPAIQGTEFAIGNGNNLLFTGTFDGNGHTISNYHIAASWTYNVSLFRTVSGKFTMKDITFDNCSATKPNNRNSSILVGTIGGGTITFDNVDIKNSNVNGVAGASAYAGKMTEGALYFIDCDVDNVTLEASSATGMNGMFLYDGYSHHDYAESGVWVENCTITNSKSVVNGVQDATVKDYNYTK